MNKELMNKEFLEAIKNFSQNTKCDSYNIIFEVEKSE